MLPQIEKIMNQKYNGNGFKIIWEKYQNDILGIQQIKQTYLTVWISSFVLVITLKKSKIDSVIYMSSRCIKEETILNSNHLSRAN